MRHIHRLYDYPDVTGVYAIHNTATKRAYIGSSTRSIWHRWRNHVCVLNAGTHYAHLLQWDWVFYGSCAFELRLLHPVPQPIPLSNDRWERYALDDVFKLTIHQWEGWYLRSTNKHDLYNNPNDPALRYKDDGYRFVDFEYLRQAVYERVHKPFDGIGSVLLDIGIPHSGSLPAHVLREDRYDHRPSEEALDAA